MATLENDIEGTLRTFISSEVLRDPEYPLKPEQSLVRGGLVDSHGLVQIAVFVEQRFGVVIPDTDLAELELDTVAALAARIRADLGAER